MCAIEATYALLARDCGLDMPETAWFDVDTKLAAFGIARFDREGGLRVPVHTVRCAKRQLSRSVVRGLHVHAAPHRFHDARCPRNP
ncbi:HipA domain-containing protein [Paraburkholderia gardini]|uniref:HipA domain-containing protein n=1 Tax=Paraburkholderia gardini TaxID=2823469 RepID=UPI00226C1DA6|nr:HipA domain-containing protein [Paraburkholderia gardini]